MRLRSLLVTVTAVLAASLLPAVPASASAPPLWRLTDLAAQRVAIADQVAAAKYGTPSPIDDPVREQQIYDSVAARAPQLGLDPADAVRFFHAQIEANKLVQRGLYTRWDAHPEERPTQRPDLDKDVRPALDRITMQLLSTLAETEGVRTSRSCEARLYGAAAWSAYDHELDVLHLKGLERALPSACARS